MIFCVRPLLYVALPTAFQSRNQNRWAVQHRHAVIQHARNYVTSLTSNLRPVFEKTCATTQKNVKSHVFWILKKNVKNVKKTYV